jgi:hypothetical protein
LPAREFNRRLHDSFTDLSLKNCYTAPDATAVLYDSFFLFRIAHSGQHLPKERLLAVHTHPAYDPFPQFFRRSRNSLSPDSLTPGEVQTVLPSPGQHRPGTQASSAMLLRAKV